MAYSEKQRQEILDKVCDELEKGLSLRKSLEKIQGPPRKTFFEWIDADSAKRNQYARACEDRADALFEEIINISDDNAGDSYTDEEGNERANHANVQRSRLRVDSRKWILSKMMPKKYGDKLDLTTDGESMNMSPEERQQRIKELIAKANADR